MAAAADDLFLETRNPEGTIVLNERCVLRTQEGFRAVIVAGITFAHYALGDRMSEAHAMVCLVEQGWANQKEVALGFGVSTRTVRRHQCRFEDEGLAALGEPQACGR